MRFNSSLRCGFLNLSKTILIYLDLLKSGDLAPNTSYKNFEENEEELNEEELEYKKFLEKKELEENVVIE